ncbi:MAG TPA: DUF554 domain-containing protein [Deinococcales bacterium]|nr:DUF554 domain-containing protein [Deinococcales bacterium]
MSGTLLNVFTVLLGATAGVLLRGRLPDRVSQTLLQVVSLITAGVGIGMVAQLDRVKAGFFPGVILALVSLAVGAGLGEWWQLEERLTAFGDQLQARFARSLGGGRFTEGFVTASLIFCVGPMTLLGSLQNGLTGDVNLLAVKSTLDGITGLALASVYGIGVAASILTILVVQGSVSLAAGVLAGGLGNASSDPVVLLMTGTGGLMILGTSINLMLGGLNAQTRERVRVGAMLPALVVCVVVYHIAGLAAR